jgi:protocatechuate 3,4-dioxygenase beta subunit
MFRHSGIIAAIAYALIVAGSSAQADDNKAGKGWIQGTVTGENGKGLPRAEIEAMRVDNRSITGITKTDSRGHYMFKKLPPGSYSITAYVNDNPVSRAIVQTRNDGWVKVDFDLRLNAKGADGVDQMQRDIKTGVNPLAGGRQGF